jgi:hypothetical protein
LWDNSVKSQQQQAYPSTPLPTFSGSAEIQFNADFFNWQRSGAPAVQISSIFFDTLPPGHYTVEAHSPNNTSDALSRQYAFKTMFYGLADSDPHRPVTRSVNNFVSPVALSGPNSRFTLALTVVQRARVLCNSVPCSAPTDNA